MMNSAPASTNTAAVISTDSEAFKMVGGSTPRSIMTDEHNQFRESLQRYLLKEVAPHEEHWRKTGIVDKEAFRKYGEAGFLALAVPEEYGGAGVDDFRYSAIVHEECARTDTGSFGFGVTTHTDLCIPYLLSFANEEQKQRWLPGCVTGENLLAIAMTEPGTGSDLQSIATTAVRDGDHYIVNGAKTFISNGINSTHVITAVKTDAGMSLLVIEDGNPGFERGRKLEKLGLPGQDTAELFFNDCRVPAENLLGEEGKGFVYLMQKLVQERLALIMSATAGAESALGATVDYVRARKAFGKSIGSFQNTRFKLAEMRTECHIARVFADWCVQQFIDGHLTVEHVAMGKWWTTDLLCRTADEGLQLHGGYGYMMEYQIARIYADARITKIYAGTNEIMKEIVGRQMKLDQ